MKKLALCAAAILLLSLAGCGSGAENIVAVSGAYEEIFQDTDENVITQADFAGSYQQIPVEISKECPYWGIQVSNTGNSSIRVDPKNGEEVVCVEPGQQMWIYCDTLFREGTYNIGFSSADMNDMKGSVQFLCAEKEAAIVQ